MPSSVLRDALDFFATLAKTAFSGDQFGTVFSSAMPASNDLDESVPSG